MRIIPNIYPVLADHEIELIHQSALRILAEAGMEIQNHELLCRLGDIGMEIDFQNQRVRFPRNRVEQFLSEAEKYDWKNHQPFVGGTAGVYYGMYHNPATWELETWTEEKLAYYFFLAKNLEHLNGALMLGCPLAGINPLEPLYERYYCWKYDAMEGGAIHRDELCPYLLDLYQIKADFSGLPLEQVFRATVYLVPPLKLGKHEAFQVAYFLKHGLRVGIGDMLAMGASAPVTVAGAVTLNLAEQIALRMLDWAFYGDKRLGFHSAVSILDMRTTIYPFGSPEIAMANVIMAQLARWYGAAFSAMAGLTDSKLPSVESGAQKALTAIPTLLAGGSFWMDAGLLSVDQVYSPVQMILDNEFLGAMKRFTQVVEISSESIGMDTILSSVPGGGFIDKEHTAHYFRGEHWQPAIWSRRMLEAWKIEGSKLDVDIAKQKAMDLQKHFQPRNGLSEEIDRSILKLIRTARERLSDR